MKVAARVMVMVLVLVGLSVSAPAEAGTVRLEAPSMNGPQAGTASPASGTATFTFRRIRGTTKYRVCWTVNHSVSQPTAAHIHVGATGVNGAIVISLFDAPFTSGASACRRVRRAVAKPIINNPPGFYVNVHSVTFPDGEIRGQLQYDT